MEPPFSRTFHDFSCSAGACGRSSLASCIIHEIDKRLFLPGVGGGVVTVGVRTGSWRGRKKRIWRAKRTGEPGHVIDATVP